MGLSEQKKNAFKAKPLLRLPASVRLRWWTDKEVNEEVDEKVDKKVDKQVDKAI